MSSSGANLTQTRFSPITDDDKAGILWIASLISGIYSICSILVRCYIKRKCFGLDDWMCALATIVGVGLFVAIYVALCQELGKSKLDATQLQVIGQSVFSSRIALIIALGLAKCSVTLLIKRLFSQDQYASRMLCDIVLGAIAFWIFGSLVGLCIRCSPQGLLQTGPAGCSAQSLRWELIGIFDAVTEFLIFLLSFGLVWRLQMRMELKLRVIAAFSFRLPLIAMASIHIRYIQIMPDTALGLAIIPPLTIEQIEIGYSLLSATIPNLKSFIMSFDTAMMMDISHKLQSSSARSNATSRQRSDQLEPGFAKVQKVSEHDNKDERVGGLRPESEGLEYLTRIHHIEHSDGSSISIEDISVISPSRDSQDKSIRCDLHWRVENSSADA